MSELAVAAPAAPVAPAAPATEASAKPASPAASIPAEGGDPAQKVAGEAPAADPEGEKPATGEDQEKQRGSRRFERKIDRLHRRAAEAEARAQLYEKQLGELKQGQAKPADPAAPKLEQFDDIEKYAQAKAQYEADKALKDHRAKQQAETQKQHRARIAGEWEDRVSKAEDKYEDFADVVGEVTPDTPLGMSIMLVDNGEDVAYHLGKNLKVAKEIAGKSPIEQAIAIGKLSAKLAAEPAKPRQPSRAPAPITPISGAATPPGEPDTKDEGAWIKWRQRQVHGPRAR